MEIWRPVRKYENKYEVSNLGNVRSIDRVVFNAGLARNVCLKGHLLKSAQIKGGYRVINLGRKTAYVHRLVCEAFIEVIPDNMTVNHIDGNKANNSASNLEILSYSDNHLHAFNVLKRKATCLGANNHLGSKSVIQYDLQGNKIATFPSAREAERQTGVKYKGISKCCLNKNKSAGRYIWQFE